MTRADVIVLAGGRASRLGGTSKPDVELHGKALLDHILDGLEVEGHVVVVGPEELARPGVLVTREEPAFGGPVAGIVAGMRALDQAGNQAPMVAVVACDMPSAAPLITDLCQELDKAVSSVEGVYALTPDAQPQPLAAAYRTEPLAHALERHGSGHGVAAKAVLYALVTHPMADRSYRSHDIDTWEDFDEAQRRQGAPW